jgi:hypothetical protein
MQGSHYPLYDIDPQTGATIEIFYAYRALETFGKCGADWFWCSHRRGLSPAGPPSKWPICYELRSLSPRADYAGANLLVTRGIVLADRHGWSGLRQKRFSSIRRRRSCINVSGLRLELLRSRTLRISARVRSH